MISAKEGVVLCTEVFQCSSYEVTKVSRVDLAMAWVTCWFRENDVVCQDLLICAKDCSPRMFNKDKHLSDPYIVKLICTSLQPNTSSMVGHMRINLFRFIKTEWKNHCTNKSNRHHVANCARDGVSS